VKTERILGYSDEISVQPGQTARFMVSSPFPGSYRAELVRLRCGDDQPAGPGLRETRVPSSLDGSYPARLQPIHAGSYAEVPDAAPFALQSFTVQTLVWSTTPQKGQQALLGTWDEARGAGYGLLLARDGSLGFLAGDGAGARELVTTGVPLLERHWYLVAASLAAESGTVLLYQIPLFQYSAHAAGSEAIERAAVLPFDVASGGAFRMAAWHGGAAPAAHFNGRLEAPRLARRALERESIEALRGPVPARLVGEVVAAWDFSREIPTTRIVDASPHHRHGELVNLPTRAVCGAAWDGSEHRWTQRPEHYAAIHFHDDDLYDCGWDSDFELRVPEELPSGVYAAKLIQGDAEEYIPFYVRPRRGTANAKLALLIPTASYYAYSNWHTMSEWDFLELIFNNFLVLDRTAVYLNDHPELGASMYDRHTDGSGVCFSSRLRPIPNMRPKEFLWQFSADTHIVDWLDEKGFAYDVVTDDDLHAEGVPLLEPYTCVMTCTHPEYYSKAMMGALQAYKASGGRLIYMGGNGFYWKIDYHPTLPGVIEMRRAEGGMRGWIAEPGEYYHASTGELGGLWRRNGMPPQAIAGTGFTAQGFDVSTYFERTPHSFDPRVSFVFEGVSAEERIGDFGLLGGGAAGWEIDRADPSLGTPPHALVVATAKNFSNGYHWVAEEFTHSHSAVNGDSCPWIRCDMVFFETPGGGAVFSTSSIAWSGSLCHNAYENNVSRITENVVRRFLDPKEF